MEEDFKKIIKQSGNNLHIYTADLLKNMGWDIDLSPYYYDDIMNKPREIDIIAQKKVDIIDSSQKKRIDEFKLFLFIECKYFKNELAFRVQRNNQELSREAIIMGRWDGGILRKEELLEQFEASSPPHHYMQERFIGKLYDSFPGRENREAIFDAITVPVKSLTSFRDGRFFCQGRFKKGLEKGIGYPVVVYSGIDGIYAIEKNANLDDLKPKKKLIFDLNYSYRNIRNSLLISNHFYIDFVHQEEFKDFIKEVIENESSILQKYLAWKFKELK